MLTAVDWVIVAVVGISAFFSIIRGFVKEAASIIAWIAAFIITGRFYSQIGSYLTFFEDGLTRNVIAIILTFVVVLVAVGFLGTMICSLVSKAGLSGFDRLLGIAFGVVRGILIMSAVLALVQILFRLHILSFIANEPWWKESLFIPELQKIANWFFLYMSSPITGA